MALNYPDGTGPDRSHRNRNDQGRQDVRSTSPAGTTFGPVGSAVAPLTMDELASVGGRRRALARQFGVAQARAEHGRGAVEENLAAAMRKLDRTATKQEFDARDRRGGQWLAYSPGGGLGEDLVRIRDRKQETAATAQRDAASQIAELIFNVQEAQSQRDVGLAELEDEIARIRGQRAISMMGGA